MVNSSSSKTSKSSKITKTNKSLIIRWWATLNIPEKIFTVVMVPLFLLGIILLINSFTHFIPGINNNRKQHHSNGFTSLTLQQKGYLVNPSNPVIPAGNMELGIAYGANIDLTRSNVISKGDKYVGFGTPSDGNIWINYLNDYDNPKTIAAVKNNNWDGVCFYINSDSLIINKNDDYKNWNIFDKCIHNYWQERLKVMVVIRAYDNNPDVYNYLRYYSLNNTQLSHVLLYIEPSMYNNNNKQDKLLPILSANWAVKILLYIHPNDLQYIHDKYEGKLSKSVVGYVFQPDAINIRK